MMSSLTFFSSSPQTSLFLRRDLRAFASPTPRIHHQQQQQPQKQCLPKRTPFADPPRPSSHRRSVALLCSASDQYSPDETPNTQYQDESNARRSFWSKWVMDTAELRSKVAKLGLAAVLAYGLFDGVTYTTFFVLAFLGYEKSTGSNPAANLKALLGIVILMWTGNNITRPFRVAGAAALAPAIDQGLKRIQKYFKFPSLIYAFALVVSIVASCCLTVVGLLILSRWGK